VKALVDSGCAKSAISQKFFKQIMNFDQSIPLTSSNVHIQTCDGTTHSVNGTVNLTFSFDKDAKCRVQTTLMVITHLADDFLLGSDILSSKLITKTTPNAIYFRNPATNEKYKTVFETKTFPVQTIRLNSLKLLHPQQTINAIIELKAFKPLEHTVALTIPDNHQLKCHYAQLDGHSLKLTISNPTNDIIRIPANTPIFNITKMTTLSTLSDDEYMTVEEKEMALTQSKQDGYYQPSVTSYIEGRNMITEADKIIIPGPINDTQFLELFDLSQFHEDEKLALSEILLNNRPAFSMHKYDIGKTNILEMDIEITTKEPKIQKYAAIAMNVRERANEILNQMEHYGIIRECHEPSPYVSNILVVLKKDKESVRLLFDGRILNYDTKRMPMSLISKAEILSKLVGKTHLSSLDFADAFYQIPLSKEAQPLTAFWTPNQGKRMCFNRAPQGLRNSPMYLKMVLDKVFYDMDDYVIFYADDLLVATSGTIYEHFEIINKVLTRLVQANLKLRPQKLLIARQTIEFLGMVFNRHTLNIPEARLASYKKLPSPNTAKQLKSAICAFSYYRHFIADFAKLTFELNELTKLTPKEFKFTAEHEKQFRSIIDHICSHAQTHFPDNSKPFYVQTDASMFCAGGRLYQKDDQGNELLIAAVSKTFTKCERNYTIYKKEALSLLYTLRSMDFYIQFAPKLIILVDSKALTYIRLAKESQGILLRFSLELSKYEADIIHVPGKDNEVADLLSRSHRDIPQIESENASKKTISEKDTIKIIEALTMPENFTLTKTQFFNLLNGPSPLDDTYKPKTVTSRAVAGPKYIKNTPKTLHTRKIKMPRTTKDKNRPGVLIPTKMLTRSKTNKNNQQPIINNDQPLEQVAPQAITDDALTLDYHEASTQIAITHKGAISIPHLITLQLMDDNIQKASSDTRVIKKNNIYYFQTRDGPKPFLPKSLVKMLIHNHHFTSPGIHKHPKQIERDISDVYYFPKQLLIKTIQQEIADCHICQLYSNKPNPNQITGLPRLTSSRLSWSVDLITDMPPSNNGYKLLLLCVDDFSNYTLAVPLIDATSEILIQAISQHIIQPFGTPQFLRSDEQPGLYNSAKFFQFLSELNIELQATAVASPFSNGRAERTIKTFKEAARKFFYQHKNINEWDKHVPIIVTAINKSINSYGYSPEEIMFGIRNPEPQNLIDIEYTNQTEQDQPTIEQLMDKIELMRRQYDARKTQKQNANITFKNREAENKKFAVGDLVLHRQLQVSTGTAGKWQPMMTGPFVIEQVQPSDKTAICQHLQKGTYIKAHFTNLTRYRLDEQTLRLPQGASAETPA